MIGHEDDEDESEEDDPNYTPFLGLKVILPTAPLRTMSCYNDDNNDGKVRSWYDYTTDHDGKQEDSLTWETLEEVTRRIHGIIDEEAKQPQLICSTNAWPHRVHFQK